MLLNTFIGTNAPGSAGVTYFLEENFEGTGYENTWDETGATGTVDEDYTTSPLQGSQSLLLSGTSQKPQTRILLPSDQDELWIFFKLRIDTSLNGTRRIVTFIDSSDTDQAGFSLTSGNVVAPFCGNTGTAATDALVNATNYNVWMHVKKGTGANGVCAIGFGTGTTEVTSGTSFCSKTNGTNTNQFHKLLLSTCGAAGTNTTGAIVLDRILVSTTGTIGDNP